jgi:hypothetical protein
LLPTFERQAGDGPHTVGSEKFSEVVEPAIIEKLPVQGDRSGDCFPGLHLAQTIFNRVRIRHVIPFRA